MYIVRVWCTCVTFARPPCWLFISCQAWKVSHTMFKHNFFGWKLGVWMV
jgi:hypothetical protein